MKSLFFAIALNVSLTLALTACSSNAKKTETPKATEEKVVATAPKAAVTKSNPAAKKADKAPAPIAAPAATASTTANAMTCASGADTRNLALSSSGTGCELMYTKNGEAKSVAKAVNETGYCAGVSEKIVTNLTAAGFSCK